MQVTVKGLPREILVHTVSLKHSPISNVFLFYCYRCATPIAKINGEISGIFPGLEPSEEVPVIKECYKCKENYVFQTREQKPSRSVKVTLYYPGHAIQQFYCVVCRRHLIQYTDSFILLLPLYMQIKLPAKIDDVCECGMHYQFIDVI